jgi:predicted porin
VPRALVFSNTIFWEDTMKRSAILAALAALASTSALAQSSVTIYGRLNASVEYQDWSGLGIDKYWALQNSASRIGFMGREDLGGGVFAGFQLEHGFDVDDGQQSQSQFWARQAEVNVGSKALGTVRLGTFTSEAYYATADYVSMHNHDTGTSADVLYLDLGRRTNKVAYRTPSFGAFTAEAAVSLNETQSTPIAEKGYDVALNYGYGGPFHVGLGWQDWGDANQIAVSASYTWDALTLGGYVQFDKNGYIANGGDRLTYRLSGMFTAGNSEFHLNAGFAEEYDNVPGSDATQWTVAYNYNLSKRTKIYSFYTQVDDSSKTYGFGGDFASFALGVRHAF